MVVGSNVLSDPNVTSLRSPGSHRTSGSVLRRWTHSVHVFSRDMGKWAEPSMFMAKASAFWERRQNRLDLVGSGSDRVLRFCMRNRLLGETIQGSLQKQIRLILMILSLLFF